MKKRLFSTLIFLFIISSGNSQTFDKAKLDQYFTALEENNKFMGSVAIRKNGDLIYTKSVGFSDIENKIEANEHTKYKIGSITKSFTAVMILKAAEHGKLDLNQTIDSWFPSIKNANKITIANLLNHRSGIHNFTNDAAYWTYYTQPKTQSEMVEIISKAGSDFEPDAMAAYSNSNYVLLSYILEKTYDKTYAELLQDLIIKPLQLKDTYVFGKLNTENNESKSYKYVNKWVAEPETDYSIPLGAGAIISTPTDLTIFAENLLNGNLLKPESLALMKTIKDGYGSGLFQTPFYSYIGYGHGGGIEGFSSFYTYFEKNQVSYALTSNGANFNRNDISIAVLSAVYGKPYDIPKFTSFNITAEDLDQYVGVYGSEQIPLKITFSKEGNTLIGQGSGQPSFPLEATDKHEFKFDQAGVKIKFNPENNTMILYQGGGEITFTKE